MGKSRIIRWSSFTSKYNGYLFGQEPGYISCILSASHYKKLTTSFIPSLISRSTYAFGEKQDGKFGRGQTSAGRIIVELERKPSTVETMISSELSIVLERTYS